MNTPWIAIDFSMPEHLMGVDVTIETPDGARLTNVAVFHFPGRWELLIDKHHFQDCKVIAWKPRPLPYNN